MALKVSGGGPHADRLVEAGVVIMGAGNQAPANGVIRNEAGAARRIRKGGVIPAGWSFDTGATEPGRGPSEDSQGSGPSETANRAPSEQWTRGDLNDYAAKLGVATPEALGNKAEVLAAIQDASAAAPKIEGSGFIPLDPNLSEGNVFPETPAVVGEAGTVIARRTERQQS
jgi:hypothetical protein